VNKSELLKLVDSYAALEERVQHLMRSACASVCAACSKVCCRPEMCRESLESPFLELVRDREKTKPTWNEARGWLGKKGCALSKGRPPVCYEFICPAIVDSLPNVYAIEKLRQLAMLLTRAGRRAKGGDHLVEIMSMDRLARIKPGRLAEKLRRAEAELFSLETSWGEF
jgi:hypothetical protein